MSARPFIGAMRYRLQLEVPVDTPDGFGGITRTYATAAVVAAQLRTYGNGRIVILMRNRTDLTEDARLRYNQRLFQVLSVDRIDRFTSFVRVSCTELRA